MSKMIYRFQEYIPDIADDVFIAPTAVVIGQAKLKSKSSIWFNTIVRADINSIEIGENTNIQDNSVVHVTHENPVLVGDRVTVGHRAILHGCTVEDDCLIGMGSLVLDGAIIKKGSVVAAGAVVSPGFEVPEDSLVMGVPARVVRKLHHRDRKKFEQNWKNYLEYAQSYACDKSFNESSNPA